MRIRRLLLLSSGLALALTAVPMAALASTVVTEHVVGIETSIPMECPGGSLSTFGGVASGTVSGAWSAGICHTQLDTSARILGGTFALRSPARTLNGTFKPGGNVTLLHEVIHYGFCTQTYQASGRLTEGSFTARLTHYGAVTPAGCSGFFATITGTATLVS